MASTENGRKRTDGYSKFNDDFCNLEGAYAAPNTSKDLETLSLTLFMQHNLLKKIFVPLNTFDISFNEVQFLFCYALNINSKSLVSEHVMKPNKKLL